MKYIFLLIAGFSLFSTGAKAQIDPCERKDFYTAKIGNGDMNDQCYTLCAGLANYLCNAPNIAEIDRQQYIGVIEVAKSSVRSMNGPGEPDCCKELLNMQPDFSKKSANGTANLDAGSLVQELTKLGVTPEDLLTAGAVVGSAVLLNEILKAVIKYPMEPKKMVAMKARFRYNSLNGHVPFLNVQGVMQANGYKVTGVEKSGSELKAGDVIAAINNSLIKNEDKLFLHLIKEAGKEVEITIQRGDKELKHQVKLEKLDYNSLSSELPDYFPEKGMITFPSGAVFYGEMDHGYPLEGTIFHNDFTYTGRLHIEKRETGEISPMSSLYHMSGGKFEFPALGVVVERIKGKSIYKFSNGDIVLHMDSRITHTTKDGIKSEYPYKYWIHEKKFQKYRASIKNPTIKEEITTSGMIQYHLGLFGPITYGSHIKKTFIKYIKKHIAGTHELINNDQLYTEYKKMINFWESCVSESEKN